ncbi:MAG: DUF1801 domain-containing protein [Spirochaetota bacterium]
MARKVILKTQKTAVPVAAFIDSIESDALKQDCRVLLELFRQVSGMEPKMWGPSIIGFGEYTYYRSNGAEGLYMATGFSPRKSGPTLYIMPGYHDYSSLLQDLGPHKSGKSCLYLKSLEGIDLEVLKALILRGLQDLKNSHQTNYEL